MRIHNLLKLLGAGTLALAANACVIRETPVNYGYGYAQGGYNAQGGVTVGEPAPYYVNDYPPEPLYETMSQSPGYGYAWIDGYWHWNGYEWVWMSGRWVQQQDGYVYVQPYYDWQDDGRYVYYPGYWSEPSRVPSRVKVIDHRDGRPRTGYQPPRHDRPGVRDHRDGGGTVRPDRDPRPPRDHRDPRPDVRPQPDRPRVDPQDRPPRDNRQPPRTDDGRRPTRDVREQPNPPRENRQPPRSNDNNSGGDRPSKPTRRDNRRSSLVVSQDQAMVASVSPTMITSGQARLIK